MDETQDNAAPAQDAAQPEATGTPPAKSAAETKLEGQLAEAKTKGEGYKKDLDTAKRSLASVTKERDKAQADLTTALGTITAQGEEIAQLKEAKASPADAQPAAATQEPSEEEYIKDVLHRNGLKVAYLLPSGPCFSEAHAREFAGEKFDSLTTIKLD